MSSKPSLSEVLRTIQTVADTAEALDDASDLVRSVRTLRRRADTAKANAAKARTRLGRAFWRWREDVLNDRADKIECGDT